MARPTYTNIADADIDLDSYVKEDILEDLRDNINACRIQIIFTDIAEQTTASATYVTMATVRVFIPNVADFTGITRKILAELEVKASAGTATFRLEDNASSDTSTEVTSTSGTYEHKYPDLTVDSGWLSGAGVVRLINIQGKCSGGGTAYMKCDKRASWYLEF